MSATQEFVERRRTPRVPVGGHTLSIVSTARVRVLDISLDGVQMVCGAPLSVGQRATLTLGLAASPFVCDLEIKQQRLFSAARQANVGAGFVDMSGSSRLSLEQFLLKAAP